MLALALTLTVLAAAPPRGLPVAHSVDLVTQIDKRLPQWLTGGGDRKALLASPAELKSFFLSVGVMPADAIGLVAETLKQQQEKAEVQQFTATRVLIEYAEKMTALSYFDAAGSRCQVSLLSVGTEAAARYLLLDGPRIDSRTMDSLLEKGRKSKSMLVFAEKTDGAWFTGTLPAPRPPDCAAVMKSALKTIFVAEKAYFAEFDSYSNSLSKVGVEVKTLGITSAKVSIAGAAPVQTFTIQVGLEGGVMRIDDKAEITVVTPCTR